VEWSSRPLRSCSSDHRKAGPAAMPRFMGQWSGEHTKTLLERAGHDMPTASAAALGSSSTPAGVLQGTASGARVLHSGGREGGCGAGGGRHGRGARGTPDRGTRHNENWGRVCCTSRPRWAGQAGAAARDASVGGGSSSSPVRAAGTAPSEGDAALAKACVRSSVPWGRFCTARAQRPLVSQVSCEHPANHPPLGKHTSARQKQI
jgi:hypothetical protein